MPALWSPLLTYKHELQQIRGGCLMVGRIGLPRYGPERFFWANLPGATPLVILILFFAEVALPKTPAS